MRINRAKRDEFALIGVSTFIMFFFARYLLVR